MSIIVMTPFDCKCMNSYLREIVLFALSLTVYEILKQNMKFQQFYLENKEEKSGTCTMRLEIIGALS